MPRPLPAHVHEATGGDGQAVRAHILDAAYRVIVKKGLAGASTRAIAAEADVGAGTLYNYFDNRLNLLAEAMMRRVHQLSSPLARLSERAGRFTVADNIRYFADHIGSTLDEFVPLGAAAFSDPDLLSEIRDKVADHDSSGGARRILVTYLKAEQDLGRVSATADCEAAASIVFRICHDHAFHRFLQGGQSKKPESFADEIDFMSNSLTDGVNDKKSSSRGKRNRS